MPPEGTAGPALIADIGGTNARFALLAAEGAPTAVRVFACADYPSLADAVRAYLGEAAPDARPATAVIAVASPVEGDRIAMTNHVWAFSIAETEKALGLARLTVVNDFVAVARAVPELSPGDTVQIGGGTPEAGRPVVVLGPGTGLGVSALVPAPGGWVAVATEGGHVTLPATDGSEEAVVRLLRHEMGHVSAERAISGSGLVRLYRSLAQIAGQTPEQLGPSEVTERALAGGDPHCRAALEMMCALLGTVAGDLALSYGALGGVFIGGGIVPKLGPFFASSPFRARFEAKGRFRDYLAGIPTRVITAENPAFIGLAALARQG